MKKLSILLILAMLLSSFMLSFSSCKKDKGNEEVTTQNNIIVNDDKIQYNMPAEDFEEFELDVLTVKSDTWNMHTAFAPTQVTGDRISSAVYKRNELVKSLYNVDIIAHEDADYYGGTDRFSADQLTGTNIYDAAYVEGSSVIATITLGQTQNLYNIPELQLDENWWSQLIKEEATVGSGKYSSLYFMQSNLSLTAFDLTWCVYFNKTLHTSHQLENFYDLVKDGSWTLETMEIAAKKVANVNSDDSFTYSDSGSAIYGITSYWNGAKALLDGCNVQFVTTDENDEIIPNISNERFTNLAQDMAELLSTEGVFTTGGPSEDGTTVGNAADYKRIFGAGRALFCIAEVKSSVKDQDFINYEGEFGILPLPKYDETQEEYRSWVNYLAPVLVIPTSNQGDRLHKTATLLDVLSFYSERDVLPEYYDIVLKGRGAKDNESVEMLDYINESKSFDASIAYGWSRQFSEVLSTAILNGVTDVSSMVDSYETIISEQIQKTMDSIFSD